LLRFWEDGTPLKPLLQLALLAFLCTIEFGLDLAGWPLGGRGAAGFHGAIHPFKI